MAEKHEHIDLVTLEQVQRLLTDTDFASVQDLASSGALGELSGNLAVRPARTTTATKVETSAQSPLPRRR